MPVDSALHVSPARSPQDFADGRLLFEEYASTLGVDLCFQGFAQELEDMPVMYGPPVGRLLLARRGPALAGCIGVRPLRDSRDECEMKRLFVRAAFRGRGLGRTLAAASIATARELGYGRMLLDTLPQMQAAVSLYTELGFRPIAPYYPNPIHGVVYMALRL